MGVPKVPRLTDLIGLLNRLYPPQLAEEWDNCGLQVGDPDALVERVLICLDADCAALEEARRQQAQAVVSHHPLIFRPLNRLTPQEMPGRALFQAIRQGIAVVSAHTNLDRAADGLNDWFAARLALKGVTPLETTPPGQFYKLVVYVPEGYEEQVMAAIFQAGGGRIGDYDQCSFRVRGLGTFRGSEHSDPFIGTPGSREEAEEYRLETIVPESLLGKVIRRVERAHPYEEVAYDLLPLANRASDVGLGRIGELDAEQSLDAFAEQVRSALEAPALRLVGDGAQPIRRVAVCGGSGMAVYGEARRRGADCLVTGDVKYHEAQRARDDGLALIDAGHFATERLMVPEVARRLRAVCAEQGFDVTVSELAGESDPFITISESASGHSETG